MGTVTLKRLLTVNAAMIGLGAVSTLVAAAIAAFCFSIGRWGFGILDVLLGIANAIAAGLNLKLRRMIEATETKG